MVCLDAIITSLYRVLISKKHLLQWVTAEQSERQSTGSISGMYKTMLISVIWGIVSIVISGKILAYILGVCWILLPLVSAAISRPTNRGKVVSQSDREFILRQAGLMWDYFEDFLNPSNNYLPPDNWQEQPAIGVARRTSPTNIGLALLCFAALQHTIWNSQIWIMPSKKSSGSWTV